MGIEDLHNLTPVPELDPMSLGVGQPPPMPGPVPQPGTPVHQQPGQRMAALGALAAMLIGGRQTAGIGQAFTENQDLRERERQQREQQSIRQAELEQVQYQRQQQAYQQTVQQKQQLAMQATTSFQKRVQAGEFTSQQEYEQAAMQTSALMQNFYGMRLTPQYFIQSAKFSMPADEDLIYQHLEKTFKNKMPGQVLNPDDTITFKGADKQPRTMKIREAIAASNFPMALGPNGEMAVVGDKPLSPSETAGKAGQFADRLALRLAGGTVPYNTREQKAAVHEQIRKEMDAEELTQKKAGKEPALADVALETAGLRRDLLAQQVEAARQNNAPKTDASASYGAERTQRIVSNVDALLPKVSKWTVGPGALLSSAPGTDAANFAAELDTLKGNIAFNELTEMRAASKTGGALGAISNVELGLLSSALGALSTKQSPASFRKQLAKIKASLQRWETAKTQQPAEAVKPMSSPGGKTYGKYTFTVEQP